MQAQLATGEPHPLEPPHLDPWMTTEPVPADPAAEDVVRAWLAAGDLDDAAGFEIDDTRTGAAYEPMLDVEPVDRQRPVLGRRSRAVPRHASHGAYRGGLGGVAGRPRRHAGVAQRRRHRRRSTATVDRRRACRHRPAAVVGQLTGHRRSRDATA